MQNYDNIDLWWTTAGDFVIEAGDIKDTSEDGLRSLVQDLITVSASSLREWRLLPGLGANIGEAIGKPNQEAVGRLVHDRLRAAIISQNIVEEEDLLITVLPVSRDELLVIYRVLALPSPYNKLGQGYALVVEVVYSHQERGMFVLEASLRSIYD